MTSAHSSPDSLHAISLPPGSPLLAEISTLAELKVTIAAFQEWERAGHSAPITFTEFQQLTGLGRTSVTRGIRSALARGTLARRPFGNSFAYYPALGEPYSEVVGNRGKSGKTAFSLQLSVYGSHQHPFGGTSRYLFGGAYRYQSGAYRHHNGTYRHPCGPDQSYSGAQ